jgi:hypothetical protein
MKGYSQLLKFKVIGFDTAIMMIILWWVKAFIVEDKVSIVRYLGKIVLHTSIK